MRTLTLRTRSPGDTKQIAAGVAGSLRLGDVVALSGELGAGKTCFVQGAAAALGITDRVTSPSFVLRRDYPGRVPVLHLDVYRLDTLADVLELGYEEALDRSRVTFIEWGDAMSPLLPLDHLEVELRLAPDAHAEVSAAPDGELAEERRVVLRPRGDDWARRFDGLAAVLGGWRADEQG